MRCAKSTWRVVVMMNKPQGLNAQGKIAVLTAIKKLAEDELKKARQDADSEMVQLYDGFGTDRAKILLGGTEVGTISLRFSSDAYKVTDKEAFDEFCLLNGLADIKRTIKPEYIYEVMERIKDEMPHAIQEDIMTSKDAYKMLEPNGDVFVLAGTSEVVPGISPAPKQIVGTTVRGCDPKVVMPALQALPGAVDQLLMGGVTDGE